MGSDYSYFHILKLFFHDFKKNLLSSIIILSFIFSNIAEVQSSWCCCKDDEEDKSAAVIVNSSLKSEQNTLQDLELTIASPKTTSPVVNDEYESKHEENISSLISLTVHPENLVLRSKTPVFFSPPGTPTFSSRLGYLLRHNLQGWESAVRMGHSSYQVVMMSGNIGGRAPQTFEEGQKWAENMINAIKSLPLSNTYRKDRAMFYITHEFAANGVVENFFKGEDDNMNIFNWKYSAKNPIPSEAYAGIISKISERLSEAPPGSSFMLGGTAIDTGNVDSNSGKKIGRNEGFLATSGSPDILKILKGSTSSIDGWNEKIFQILKGESYIETVPLKKLVPNLSDGSMQDLVAFSICKDASIIDKFPPKIAMYFITGAGLPHNHEIVATDPQTTKILVDVDQVPSLEFSSSLTGGIYELESPEMKKFFGTSFQFWTLQPGQAVKALFDYARVNQHRFSIRGTGGSIIVTMPRPIPISMSSQDLTDAENKMVKEQATILSPTFDHKDSSATSKDSSENAMRETFEASKGKEEEAKRDFGKEKK